MNNQSRKKEKLKDNRAVIPYTFEQFKRDANKERTLFVFPKMNRTIDMAWLILLINLTPQDDQEASTRFAQTTQDCAEDLLGIPPSAEIPFFGSEHLGWERGESGRWEFQSKSRGSFTHWRVEILRLVGAKGVQQPAASYFRLLRWLVPAMQKTHAHSWANDEWSEW